MNIDLKKEEIEIIKELVSIERKQLSSLNFSATKEEVDKIRILAPLEFKLKNYE